MKRKLIDFDVFKKINEESLSSAEAELSKCEEVLAKALGIDELSLHCYGESDVTYATADAYVHANYRIANNNIIFENIEELVIDESSAKKEQQKHLTNMVEQLLTKNGEKQAMEHFRSYMSMPITRRQLIEGKVNFWIDKPKAGTKKRGQQPPEVVAKRIRAKQKSQALVSDSDKKAAKSRRDNLKHRFGNDVRIHARFKNEPKHQIKKSSKKMVKEWSDLVEAVCGYIDYKEFGPIMKESEIRRDDKGNIVAVRIPTSQVRNESKIITMTHKNMLDTELKVLRGKMKTVHEDDDFCRAMSDLRRANAVSDAKGLQDVLENVVKAWPDVLCLTQNELSKRIAVALETAGEKNYDDDTCNFLADGILQTAANAYSDKVQKVARFAGAELPKEGDVYEAFQAIVNKFYPSLDESTQLEQKMFVDLYNALVDIHTIARKEGNEILRSEANVYLKELHAIISEETEMNFELAEEVTGWLADLVEANVPGAEEVWNVSNTAHTTVGGDHPRMAWAAKQTSATASNHNGDMEGAPVSDGKSYKNNLDKEMANNAWGNWSSDETWPSLKNPYVPKPFGDYKMKEPSAVNDGENDWSRYNSDDTWPNLKNPNVKDSPWDKDKYKMNSDNLVTDK